MDGCSYFGSTISVEQEFSALSLYQTVLPMYQSTQQTPRQGPDLPVFIKGKPLQDAGSLFCHSATYRRCMSYRVTVITRISSSPSGCLVGMCWGFVSGKQALKNNLNPVSLEQPSCLSHSQRGTSRSVKSILFWWSP